MSDPCLFCEIIAGRVPSSIVAESDGALAFLTIGPLREGHTLVVPKVHATELPDASSEQLAAVFALGKEVAERQRRALGSEGETLFLASGSAGEQSVGHLHLHVVPRTASDGLGLTPWWEERVTHPDRERLEAVARRLRPR